MSTRTCPACANAVRPQASFCPACGHALADAPSASPKSALAGPRPWRETILGWLFLLVGLTLMLNPFLHPGGIRAWIGAAVGIGLALVGLGCLVGEQQNPRVK